MREWKALCEKQMENCWSCAITFRIWFASNVILNWFLQQFRSYMLRTWIIRNLLYLLIVSHIVHNKAYQISDNSAETNWYFIYSSMVSMHLKNVERNTIFMYAIFLYAKNHIRLCLFVIQMAFNHYCSTPLKSYIKLNEFHRNVV